MRTDEQGNPCPATLGEYRDLCAVLGVENNAAVALLDKMIAKSPQGRDEELIVDDSQMRAVLMPMLLQKKGA